MSLCTKYNIPSNEAATHSETRWNSLVKLKIREKMNLDTINKCREGKKTTLLGLSKNRILQEPYITILPQSIASSIFRIRCQMIQITTQTSSNRDRPCRLCKTDLETAECLTQTCPETRNIHHKYQNPHLRIGTFMTAPDTKFNTNFNRLIKTFLWKKGRVIHMKICCAHASHSDIEKFLFAIGIPFRYCERHFRITNSSICMKLEFSEKMTDFI